MPSLLAYWIHDLDPVIVQFTDQLAIRYYGLAYLAGFACAFGFMVWAGRKGRSPLSGEELEVLVSYLFFGVILGGRLGYMLLYDTQTLWRDPLEFFRVWDGGMASHGGFIGVFLAAWLYARRHRKSLFALGDLICVAAPPGLFFGRLANFINGELWGKVTDAPWAVVFPEAQVPPYFDPNQFTWYSAALDRYVNPRHPSQLYEALLEGLLLGVYLQWRFWSSRGKAPAGQLAGEFFLFYGIVRVIGELFREPDYGIHPLLGLSRGTFYSVVTILGGIAIIVAARRRSRGIQPS